MLLLLLLCVWEERCSSCLVLLLCVRAIAPGGGSALRRRIDGKQGALRVPPGPRLGQSPVAVGNAPPLSSLYQDDTPFQSGPPRISSLSSACCTTAIPPQAPPRTLVLAAILSISPLRVLFPLHSSFPPSVHVRLSFSRLVFPTFPRVHSTYDNVISRITTRGFSASF